jgi:hypothetical protein
LVGLLNQISSVKEERHQLHLGQPCNKKYQKEQFYVPKNNMFFLNLQVHLILFTVQECSSKVLFFLSNKRSTVASTSPRNGALAIANFGHQTGNFLGISSYTSCYQLQATCCEQVRQWPNYKISG